MGGVEGMDKVYLIKISMVFVVRASAKVREKEI